MLYKDVNTYHYIILYSMVFEKKKYIIKILLAQESTNTLYSINRIVVKPSYFTKYVITELSYRQI